MKMDFRWCLSVGPVIIWFLSSLPSSQLKTGSIESSTTTAFPQPSTTTPGGSAGGSTTTAAPQPYQVYLWNILLGWYWYQYA
ncbi:uncharacterized protein LOC129854568 isoform X5 [Salvelinus fontinalis]|uniref:uncharacterized protein LOC129854568 isoform X5 n=1 Tax=Salvelinus fontinalis TaxID=8038 RepID=UPI002485F7A5|nr:uncharacterized protein LOC129854568 isoform X5 [Salvelinus fontinalis]